MEGHIPSRCGGVLVVHVDESAWCDNPRCAVRWVDDWALATGSHRRVVQCGTQFPSGCPACRDIEHWRAS